MFYRKNFRLVAVLAAASAMLTGCAGLDYRCPLDPGEEPDDPTACVSMSEAMRASRLGTGTKTSAMLDADGKLVQLDVADAKRGAQKAGEAGPYTDPKMRPVYHQPKVFQVWTGAYVDKQGNLHDGRTSWFATEGAWGYGRNQAQSNLATSQGEAAPHAVQRTGMMRPSTPADVTPQLKNIITPENKKAAVIAAKTGAGKAADPAGASTSDKAKTDSAMRALSNSLQTAVKPSPAPGVTAPAVSLTD